MKIGENLKKRRIKCSYSINDVASILGISVSDLRDIESDVKTPTLEQLSLLAKIYTTSIDELCYSSNGVHYYIKGKKLNKIDIYFTAMFVLAAIMNFILLLFPIRHNVSTSGVVFYNFYDYIFKGGDIINLSVLIINIIILFSSILFLFFDNKFSKYILLVLSVGLITCLVFSLVELTNPTVLNAISGGLISMLIINCLVFVFGCLLLVYRKKAN